MSCKKKHSATQKENYKAYEREMRWKKNRTRRLMKHIENFPNDGAAEKALDRLDRQKTPRHCRKAVNPVKVIKPDMDCSHIEIRTFRSEMAKLGIGRTYESRRKTKRLSR
jgi:hypothetical protein